MNHNLYNVRYVVCVYFGGFFLLYPLSSTMLRNDLMSHNWKIVFAAFVMRHISLFQYIGAKEVRCVRATDDVWTWHEFNSKNILRLWPRIYCSFVRKEILFFELSCVILFIWFTVFISFPLPIWTNKMLFDWFMYF